MASDTTLLACPVCGQPLQAGPGTLSCPSSHSFDIARSGYVNLLPSRKKLSPTVGDSREMLAARERFLRKGHFAPLEDTIAELATEAIDHGAAAGAVAEVGAGTGHYIGDLPERLGAPGMSYFGFDISKEAVKLAARLHPEITFALADVNRQIPLVTGSAVLLLDVFAPRNAAEFRRVLSPGGLLIVVLPAPDHLAELVERFDLLTVPDDKVEEVLADVGSYLRPVDRKDITDELRLSATDALDLIAMGPSARHVDLMEIGTGLEGEVTATSSFTVLAFRPG
jgi:23S rRNA (guanine745-N1)-methyltransferase